MLGTQIMHDIMIMFSMLMMIIIIIIIIISVIIIYVRCGNVTLLHTAASGPAGQAPTKQENIQATNMIYPDNLFIAYKS